MPDSVPVWLVCDEQEHPIAAFTKKYVCAYWLEQRSDSERDRFHVWRVPINSALNDDRYTSDEVIDWCKRHGGY